MKPILFDTEMVRAILDGRKTVTRRVIRNGGSPADYGREHYNGLRHGLNGDTANLWAGFYMDSDIFYIDGEKHIDAIYFKAPYKPGDILYVRERVAYIFGRYVYRADYDKVTEESKPLFKPSIHMPREAARIFLRVTDVRVERLQDVTEEQAKAEGVEPAFEYNTMEGPAITLDEDGYFYYGFKAIWDSTIKPKDRAQYGWEANPWVWVIEFERISKEEAYK